MQIICPNCKQQFNLNDDTKEKKENNLIDCPVKTKQKIAFHGDFCYT